MKIISLLALLGASVLIQNASAALFEFNLVRREPIDFHQSFTVDVETGKYYQRPGIGFTGQNVLEYENASAFAAGLPSRTITLEGGYYGTYVAARNGKLYGRTELNGDFSGSGSSRFDLGTGAIEHTQAFPNFGRNGDDTFAWGGLTSMNFYNDQAGMFLLGKSDAPGGQTWQLSRVDTDLNVIESKSFVIPEIGFAVMVNGKLLIGQHTFTPEGELVTDGFSSVLDFETGALEDVDHQFARLGGLQYIDDIIYDAATDQLVLHNRGGTGEAPAFYMVDRFEDRLNGVIVSHLPESLNTVACLGLAAAGMLVISRRARFAKS